MKSKAKIISLFIILTITIAFFAYSAISIVNIPEKIKLIENQRPEKNGLYSMDINVGHLGALIDGKISDDRLSLSEGKYQGTLKMFGIIDIKTVEVDVIKNKKLVPCGNSIGVKLFTDGLLVVGLSDFLDTNNNNVSPAKKSGMKVGDLIKSINRKEVKTLSQFSQIIEKCEGNEIELVIQRNNKNITLKTTPIKAKTDGTYKLGMWIRDSTAGIGTLTFYNPEDKVFGALGHGISDLDTGELMPASSGDILQANIISVKKGAKGTPGELQGIFLNSASTMGNFKINTNYGIYGKVTDEHIISGEAIPIALKDEVKEGSAYILSNVDGQKVEKFTVSIQKVMEQNERSTKGMIIKITDNNLIEKTGGIVQGMSGSPIIQDGKLIGAVTHVFVNDPQRGYGIFIETMLKNAY